MLYMLKTEKTGKLSTTFMCYNVTKEAKKQLQEISLNIKSEVAG